MNTVLYVTANKSYSICLLCFGGIFVIIVVLRMLWGREGSLPYAINEKTAKVNQSLPEQKITWKPPKSFRKNSNNTSTTTNFVSVPHGIGPTINQVKASTKTFSQKIHSLQNHNNFESNLICEEFELSSNEIISRHMPESLGLYRRSSEYYNDRVVYDNTETGLHLFYIHCEDDNGIFQNFWMISKKKGSPLTTSKCSDHSNFTRYEYNGCDYKYIPSNGACDHGWYFAMNKGRMEYIKDTTARITCSQPAARKHEVVRNSICKKYWLRWTWSPAEWFVTMVLTDDMYNQRVIYQGESLDRTFYMYYYDAEWLIGPRIGSPVVFLKNEYCKDVEYPANGECSTGWCKNTPDSFVCNIYNPINCTEY